MSIPRNAKNIHSEEPQCVLAVLLDAAIVLQSALNVDGFLGSKQFEEQCEEELYIASNPR